MSWLSEAFQSLGLDFLTEKLNFQPKAPIPQNKNPSNEIRTGKVVRLGTKEYDAEHSTPASRKYTTKKNPQASIVVESQGVKAKWRNSVQEGDLGENVYVETDYTFFEVGKRYKFYTEDDTSKVKKKDKVMPTSLENNGVVIEITERIEPCGNLCRLPYINDEALEPRQRFENCKKFLLWLDEKEGLRGWYGKVLVEGNILLGDVVAPLTVSQETDAGSGLIIA